MRTHSGQDHSWVDVEKFGIAKQLWFERFLALPNGMHNAVERSVVPIRAADDPN